eukprot:CAMPEP_0185251582 /NCGR_PEP_ID=MMETSP1359-20130426/955_1 /TAXON_ID=552665 /ORGANISM="Bigelowiella longifila, Strain CCMP242" /LENGTH=378 /DNA_ID=CAMNT_0027833533 /DNA_START=204 /DNA_END=1341 /DNA_ORIENTATION=-
MGGVNGCERSSCTFRQTQSPEDWDSKRDSWPSNVNLDLSEQDGTLEEQDGDSSSEPPTRSCANDCYVRKPYQSTYKRTHRARSGPSADPTNISPMGQNIGKKTELYVFYLHRFNEPKLTLDSIPILLGLLFVFGFDGFHLICPSQKKKKILFSGSNISAESANTQKSRSRTTLPVDAGEDDEEEPDHLQNRDSTFLLPAKSTTTSSVGKRESSAEMDSTGECTTASGSISASPALSPQPVSNEITKSEDRKRINVFTDPLNWVDTEAVFAWTVTIVNALTKEKEQLSVYNNNTVGEVKKSFIANSGCSTGMRLFHLVGMKCQELEDDWELRHCIRNRASVIAYAGDLPALLKGAGALKSEQPESEQHMAQQTVVVGQS